MHDEPEDEASAIARRQAFTAEVMARTGITEAMIHRLVHTFYDRIRQDPMLAPVFEARIAHYSGLPASDRVPALDQWLAQAGGPEAAAAKLFTEPALAGAEARFRQRRRAQRRVDVVERAGQQLVEIGAAALRGIVLPARIDADRDLLDLTRALVEPRSRRHGWRRFAGLPAEALGLGLR